MKDESNGADIRTEAKRSYACSLHPLSYVPLDTARPMTTRWISLVPS